MYAVLHCQIMCRLKLVEKPQLPGFLHHLQSSNRCSARHRDPSTTGPMVFSSLWDVMFGSEIWPNKTRPESNERKGLNFTRAWKHLLLMTPKRCGEAVEKHFNSVVEDQKQDYLDFLFDRDVAPCTKIATEIEKNPVTRRWRVWWWICLFLFVEIVS